MLPVGRSRLARMQNEDTLSFLYQKVLREVRVLHTLMKPLNGHRENCTQVTSETDAFRRLCRKARLNEFVTARSSFLFISESLHQIEQGECECHEKDEPFPRKTRTKNGRPEVTDERAFSPAGNQKLHTDA